MIKFFRHLFQNCKDTHTNEAFKNSSAQTALNSEKALINNQNAIEALEQIRLVEQIARRK